MHERLLYRLSESRYRDNFDLKGGALLFAYEHFAARPTLIFSGKESAGIKTISRGHLRKYYLFLAPRMELHSTLPRVVLPSKILFLNVSIMA